MIINSRREFLGLTSAAISAATLVPRHVLGGNGYTTPSGKLNIAGVGIGGVGRSYLDNIKSENIIALCDVDDEYAAKTYALYPDAKRYRDFREMLDKQPEIDAVVIGAPDHAHTYIALHAMKMKKHVYCAKPLARTIHEAHLLSENAAETGVATQMSCQNNATEDHRLTAEWIADGAIGEVREVHIWSDRPIWPQGLNRPAEIPACPDTIDWGLWIGPAPWRPYHPVYHPFKWRGWWDFGTGAIGDMGCHGFDPIFRALKLGHPISVQASSTKLFEETAPIGSIVHFEFPARDGMPPVELTWYDGGLEPGRPKELEENRMMGADYGGILYIGDRGIIMSDGIGTSPRLIPETAMQTYKKPAPTLPRSIGHYQEWIAACKGGPPAGCQFGYGAMLTEIVLLGNIAIRTGKKLYWDPANLRITNDEEANKYIRAPYRTGWEI